MKTWLRLLLVLETVGGGFTGMVVIFSAFSSHSIIQDLLLVVFFALYGFVTASGLLFVHNPKRTALLKAALALQIPVVALPFFLYEFASGLFAFFTWSIPLSQNRIGFHFNWNIFFGARFQILFGSNHSPLVFGVNIAALLLLILLHHATQSSDPAVVEPVMLPNSQEPNQP